MTYLIAAYLLFLSAVVVTTVFVQAFRGTVGLMSTRNFFALGFLMFQPVSATWSLITEDYGTDVYVTDPSKSGFVFAIMCTIFLVIFHWAYMGGWGAKRIAPRLNPTFPVPTTSSMIAVAAILILLAAICRYALAYIPLIGIIGNNFSVGLMPAAAAVIVWAWMPQLLNPVVTFLSAPLLLFTLFMSVYQTFGRRDLVSVLAACLWAAFHGYWKYKGSSFMIKRLAILGTAGVVAVAAYTGVREKTTTETSATELISKIGDSDLWYGLFSMASGQVAGGISMHIIETRPEVFPFDPFHSAIYFITNPIPRAVWAGKPEALGFVMVKQLGIKRKAEEFNLGPGLMGHIWNDNPFISMVPYAIFLGLMLRAFDEIVKVHGFNPFLVVPCGVMIGDIIALGRGELGLFLTRIAFGTFAAFGGMIVASRLLRSVGWPMAAPGSMSSEPEAFEDHAFTEDSYPDQGADGRAA